MKFETYTPWKDIPNMKVPNIEDIDDNDMLDMSCPICKIHFEPTSLHELTVMEHLPKVQRIKSHVDKCVREQVERNKNKRARPDSTGVRKNIVARMVGN